MTRHRESTHDQLARPVCTGLPPDRVQLPQTGINRGTEGHPNALAEVRANGPTSRRRKGTILIKCSYPEIGLIRRASGTHDPLEVERICECMDQLHMEKRFSVLEAIRDGHIRPSDVFDHDGETPRSRHKEQQFIYVLRAAPSGNLKIGIAVDPHARLMGMQSGTWEQLRFVLTMPGDMKMERAIHADFAEHCIAREWFRPAPEILEWIEAMRSEVLT